MTRAQFNIIGPIALIVTNCVSILLGITNSQLQQAEQGAREDAAQAARSAVVQQIPDSATSFTITNSAGAPFTTLFQLVEYRCPVCKHAYHITLPVGEATTYCLVQVRTKSPDGRASDLCWNPCPHCLRRILRDIAGVPEMVRQEAR